MNFGRGTRLIITNQPVKEPEVTTLKSSMEDVRRQGFAIYMCNLQNFFPDVIRVAWYEGDSEVKESEQSEIEHKKNSSTYSLNSWIKVMKSDLGKTFTCKYKHEKTGDQWGMESVSWKEHFQDQSVKNPEVTILKSSMAEVARDGFAVYTCNLQNFFPDVMRVIWYEGDSTKEVKSEKSGTEYNSDNNTYSLSSWIKVPKHDLEKTFTCKYSQGLAREGWINTPVSGNEYIQDQSVKNPEVTILKSSMAEVSRDGFAVYTCNLQNFFPDVMRVIWYEGDSTKEVKSEKSGTEYNSDNNTYSLSSWIKVPIRDLEKTFTCKYNQGVSREGWKNASISGNEYIQDTPSLNHMTYRAAQMTYAILLLKSVLYCPFLIFLKTK